MSEVSARPGRDATILVGGDICPIGRNTGLFVRGDAKGLFGDLLEEFERADLVVANLECPLVRRQAPIEKTGPVFGAESACINGIRAAGFDLLCLANNHIFDHGPGGLENTLTECAQAGIATVGAGRNLDAARAPFIRKVGGHRVAILAMAEHEFSIATCSRAGANPLDLIDYTRQVASLRGAYDHLIVLLHGGPEFITVPSPRLRKTCRFLVEMGAHTVVVQHPHAFGGYERYRSGCIVYGQGALVMDEGLYRNLKTFHEGFLVHLTIRTDGEAAVRFVPFVQSSSAAGARKMAPAADASFQEFMDGKAAAIANDEYVEQEWLRFCRERQHGYLSAVLGHNRLFRIANRRGLVTRLLHGRKALLQLRNVLNCETHRDALQTLLDDMSRERP